MKYLLLPFILIFLSCTAEKTNNTKAQDNESLAIATIYQQISAEYDALCYQAYNNASDIILSKSESDNSYKAVVLDIDETVLDNTPYEVVTITENLNFPACWDEWCKQSDADLVPGVKGFLMLADSLGYEVFYVSNRKVNLLNATIENLKLHMLPDADSSHVLLRNETGNKDPRREIIKSRGYQIELLIGDNLGDFSNVFQVEDNSEREKLVVENLKKFGTDYIVLPNPMYGKWLENTGFYSSKNRDSLYKKLLKGFDCK